MGSGTLSKCKIQSLTQGIGSGMLFGSATSFTARTSPYSQYIGPNMAVNQNPVLTPGSVSIPVPIGGIISNLRVTLDGSDAGTLGTTIISVQVIVESPRGTWSPSSYTSGVSCSVTGQSYNCADFANTQFINPGDRFAIRVTGTSTTSNVSFSNLIIQWSVTLSGS